MTRLGVWYDFRNPAAWRLPWRELYDATLRQAAHAEQLGFDSVWLSEHHFTDEGYLPSVAAMLAVLARGTAQVRLGTAVLLAPLHHPLRLAEDLAVADQLSGGRVEVGLAPGYRPSEFAALGVPHAERGPRTDETIELLRRAWTGERFSWHGRFFHFDDVVVTPPPATPGGPPLWIGGSTARAAERALRYRCRFMPDSGAPESVVARYLEAFEGQASERRVATNRVIVAAPTRQRAWEICGAHVLYQFNVYRRWFAEAGDPDEHGQELTDVGQLSREHYFVGTPDDIVAAIEASRMRHRYDELIFWARPPGMDFEASTRSLELIAEHVLPALAPT